MPPPPTAAMLSLPPGGVWPRVPSTYAGTMVTAAREVDAPAMKPRRLIAPASGELDAGFIFE